MIKIIAVIGLIGAMLFPYSARSTSARTDAPVASPGHGSVETVSLCKLTRNPSRYLGKPLKLNAIIVSYFPDVWFMYDENCPTKPNRLIHYLDCKSEKQCNHLKNLLSANQDGNGERFRSRVTVIGKLQIETSVSQNEKRILKFGISAVESTSLVSTEVQWP
jgi:hypothetical protein